jgi:hypothetical protein
MKSLTPLTKLVLLTLFSVLMLINRMEQQKENIDIWSKWGSLLSQAQMPLKYWDKAFLAVTFLINCTPSKV